MMKNLMRSRGWGVLPPCSPVTERCAVLSHSLVLRNTSTSLGSKGTSELQSSSLRHRDGRGGGGSTESFETAATQRVTTASLFGCKVRWEVLSVQHVLKEYSLPRLQRVHINEPLKGGHKCLQPLLQIAHIFLQGGGKDSRQPRAFGHMHNVAKRFRMHIYQRKVLFVYKSFASFATTLWIETGEKQTVITPKPFSVFCNRMLQRQEHTRLNHHHKIQHTMFGI